MSNALWNRAHQLVTTKISAPKYLNDLSSLQFQCLPHLVCIASAIY